MLKSCPYCGRVHDTSYDCGKKPERTHRPKSSARREDRFRWTSTWKRKREEIAERDHWLCQSCLNGLSPHGKGIVTSGLEVHHIESLKDNWRARLDSLNLVTLCEDCHELAERGAITPPSLMEIAKINTERTEGAASEEPPAFAVL
jgi:5-methylcytosine-specific restriction endonuclease McrA